ncbi:MAG: hypothetical protein N3F66_04630 [Spirochaetes bacterium]|nr:hypothetical protein [Spirochaetota bacterium]
MGTQEKQPERILVMDEITSILTSDNIIKALANYKPNTPEKEHAIEFVKAHYNFIQEIVTNDIQQKIVRSDFEIKDLVAHVNALMQHKDEYIFTTLVMHSPRHYQQVQKAVLQEMNKEEKEK